MAHNMGKVLAVVGLMYAARRYFRDWGTTKEESGAVLAGDELLARPELQATEGVWIEAPAEQVWPWLVQIGQGRGGLYSFEMLEHVPLLNRHNADVIDPGWQKLEVGGTVRLVPKDWMCLREGIEMKVVDVIEPRSIVLRSEQPELRWGAVLSFHLLPRGEDRCRLLIRSRLALRRPGEVVLAEIAGPVRALVTRGILLGIKRRVERRSADSVLKQPVDQ